MNARKREEATEQEHVNPDPETEAPDSDPAVAELARLRAREDEDRKSVV